MTQSRNAAPALNRDEIVAKIEAEIEAADSEQDYWIAVHAIRTGLYEVSAERRAEFDPLGLLFGPKAGWDKEEEIANHLTREELSEAREAGEDDYWELADSEKHEAFDLTAGYIDGLGRALKIIRGEA